MAIYNGTLVKLNLSGNFLELETYNRAFSRKRRFFIDPEPFGAWIESGTAEYFERDIGHFLEATKSGDIISIKLHWHHSDTFDFTTYEKQSVVIPAAVIQSALAGNPIRYLHTEKQAMPKLDFSYAANTIREICSDKQKRRAFSKGLRQSFQWPGSRPVAFCGDTPLGVFENSVKRFFLCFSRHVSLALACINSLFCSIRTSWLGESIG